VSFCFSNPSLNVLLPPSSLRSSSPPPNDRSISFVTSSALCLRELARVFPAPPSTHASLLSLSIHHLFINRLLVYYLHLCSIEFYHAWPFMFPAPTWGGGTSRLSCATSSGETGRRRAKSTCSRPTSKGSSPNPRSPPTPGKGIFFFFIHCFFFFSCGSKTHYHNRRRLWTLAHG
jgi:hypothetical protein